ncbi:MAG: NAD(P)(+) transhydrogenase (Re/Si-specific) subunit alpha, partial [Terriglobia bacterium]
AQGYARQQDEAFYERQREVLGRVVAESDVVITTAVVPGRKAPVLITQKMVQGMAPGSVIVDLATERGGNCELTQASHVVIEHGVTVIGTINLASSVPYHASQMYAKNLTAFVLNLIKAGKLALNLEDEIIRETLLTRNGEIVNKRVRDFFALPAEAAAKSANGR